MRARHSVVESQELSNVKDLILILLKEGGEQEIAPTTIPGLGVYYVLAGFHVPADKLMSRYREAFLEVKRYVTFPSCSTCRSTSLRLEVLCPSCRGTDLTRVDLVVHYECGFVGGIEDFSTSQGMLDKCPKCGKPLKRVGIDYGRPGLGFRCQRCGAIFQYPLTNLVCDKGHSTSLDKIQIERYPVFTVSSELWKTRQMVELLQTLQADLKASLGLSVDILDLVRGKSGMTHLIHMLVRSGSKLVAVEFLDLDSEMMDAMSVVSKAVDLGIHFIVVVSEERASDLRRILHPSYFSVIPAKRLSAEDIRDALLESVYSIVSQERI